jgi:hypothetical protein
MQENLPLQKEIYSRRSNQREAINRDLQFIKILAREAHGG